VRLIDNVFRQGHLSERALIDAVVAGERPRHLDQCDLCAERAVALARWMDEVQSDATDLADDLFTPERLQAQQQQVMRRLEQLDQPARVIAFPAASRADANGSAGRRVAVSWVGLAAAAGLVIGVIGGQVSARLTHQAVTAPVSAAVTPSADATLASDATAGPAVDSSVLDNPYENLDVPSLVALNDMMPRVTQAARR
jgi:anti-sigma factor RsiW